MEETKSPQPHVHTTPVVATHVPVSNSSSSGSGYKGLVFLVVVSLIVSLISLYGIFSLHSKFNTLTGAAVAPPEGGDELPSDELPGQEQPSKVDVTFGSNPAEGNKDAPVTIVEFSDFQCPFCERFYTQTLSQIRENYVKTGKVKIYFRHFPLSFHENAQKAAEASQCAAEQGKFWEMHNKLFENKAKISVTDLKQYAKDLKLDTAKFNTCLDTGKTAAIVQKDFADGQKFGVSGTPSFFVNGQLLVGAQPFTAFKTAIDAALAAK